MKSSILINEYALAHWRWHFGFFYFVSKYELIKICFCCTLCLSPWCVWYVLFFFLSVCGVNHEDMTFLGHSCHRSCQKSGDWKACSHQCFVGRDSKRVGENSSGCQHVMLLGKINALLDMLSWRYLVSHISPKTSKTSKYNTAGWLVV